MNADDPKFTAHALGEFDDLTPAERAEIEALLASDPAAAAEAAETRALAARLRAELPGEAAPALEEEQRAAVLSAVGTVDPATKVVRFPRRGKALAAIAAGVVVTVLGLRLFPEFLGPYRPTEREQASVAMTDPRSKIVQNSPAQPLDEPTVRLATETVATPPILPTPLGDGVPAKTASVAGPAAGGQLALNDTPLTLNRPPAASPFAGGTSIVPGETPPAKGGIAGLSPGAAPAPVAMPTVSDPAAAEEPTGLRTAKQEPIANGQLAAMTKAVSAPAVSSPAQGVLVEKKSQIVAAQRGSGKATASTMVSDVASRRAKVNLPVVDEPTGVAFADFPESGFLVVPDQPLSTFGLDVDTAGYSVVRRFLNENQLPPRGTVRIEELLNYFTYDYPLPKGNAPFSATMEVASCPWAPEHRLVRVGLRGREVAAEQPTSTPVTIARDVKIQVEFNPAQVGAYRLIGYEKRALANEDSNGGRQDAGGIRAGHTVTALYEVIPAGLESAQLAMVDQLKSQPRPEKAAAKREPDPRGAVEKEVALAPQDPTSFTSTAPKAPVAKPLPAAPTSVSETADAAPKARAATAAAPLLRSKMEREASAAAAPQLLAPDASVAPASPVPAPAADHAELLPPAPAAPGALAPNPTTQQTKRYFVDEAVKNRVAGAARVKDATTTADPRNLAGAVPSAIQRELLTLTLRYQTPDTGKNKLLEFPLTDSGKSWEKSSADFRFAAAVAGYGMLLRDSNYAGDATWDSVLKWAHEGVGPDASGDRKEFLGLVERAKELSR